MGLHAGLKRADAAAHYDAGEACHRRGELAQALGHYDDALGLEPRHGPSLRLSALALYQQGALVEALARAERAIEAHPGDAEVWSAYGVILAAQGRGDAAAGAYRRGLDLTPEDGVLWFNLGLVERALGHWDPAILALTAAAERLSGAAAHHELGFTLQGAGRPLDAARAYARALDLGAGAESALNAGAACQQAGDIPAAEAFYQRALAMNPACVRTLNNLAVMAQDRGDAGEAAALCRRAVAIDPTVAEAWNNLGVALQRLGEPAEAEAAYRAALAAASTGGRALDNLTELLFDQARGDEAVALCRAATLTRPIDPGAWLDLARVMERADDLSGAESALARASDLDPRDWTAPHRRGALRQRSGALMAAMDLHRRACALAPREPDAWRQFALAAIKAGDGHAALAALGTLLRLDPLDPQAWAYKALALRQAGQDDAADALTADDALVAILSPEPPPGYVGPDAFHAALKAELAAVRLRAWSPRGQSVVNGYQTQNDLFAEPAPAIQALRSSIDATVAQFLDQPGEAVRRFIPAPPARRRYLSWSVNLKAGGHHAPHIHPEGCLSGVYYVETPDAANGLDLGGLEFGRPGVDAPLPAAPPLRVVAPQRGRLVLFPSYLWHGTRDFGAPGERITVAFDLLR